MWSSFQLIGRSKDYMATVHSGYTNEMWPDFSVLLEYFFEYTTTKVRSGLFNKWFKIWSIWIHWEVSVWKLRILQCDCWEQYNLC